MIDHERHREIYRQTGLLWQYRAMHYSASRGKNGTFVNTRRGAAVRNLLYATVVIIYL